LAVQPLQRFTLHLQFHLRVFLKHLGIGLPQLSLSSPLA
jgi:hypothetical protein